MLFILIFVAKPGYGQEPLKRNPFWLNFSAGGLGEYFGIATSFNKSLQEDSYQVTLNFNSKSILSKRGLLTGNAGLGRSIYTNWYIASFHAGPSLSYGEGVSQTGNRIYFMAGGLSLNSQLYLMPLYRLFPGVGFGFEFYYNFNLFQPKTIESRHVYSFRIGVCITSMHDK